jgi:hypothetical protein
MMEGTVLLESPRIQTFFNTARGQLWIPGEQPGFKIAARLAFRARLLCRPSLKIARWKCLKTGFISTRTE